MSIIYEALKKVERSVTLSPASSAPALGKPASRPHFFWYLAFFFLLGACAIGVVFHFILAQSQPKLPTIATINPVPVIAKKPEPRPAPTVVAAPEPKIEEPPVSYLTLNGVFFSNGEGYALINNEIVKEGDTIDGAQVVKVNADGVRLKRKDQEINLRVNKR